jgi:RimJ/RimL family protein N-acetyltransferase
VIARRNLPAVGATRAEIKRAKKAMMKVRHWSTSRIVAGDLELRSYTADDLQPFVRSVDEDVLYWQGFDERTLEYYRQWLYVLVRWPHRVAPQRFLAVAHGSRFAGHYSIAPSTGRRDRWDVELGWWLAPEARGKGLGRASLAAALRYVHRELGLGVARMGTEVDNVRAVRQIEANGAVPVDEGPHTVPNGRVVTARWYRHEQSY